MGSVSIEIYFKKILTGVSMPNLNDLALKFSVTLHAYLVNPLSNSNQQKLIQESCELYKEAVKNGNIEPDQYLPLMEDALAIHLKEIKMTQEQGRQLDKFNRLISLSDDYPPYAFHALTLAYNYLKNNSLDTDPYSGGLPELDEDIVIKAFTMI